MRRAISAAAWTAVLALPGCGGASHPASSGSPAKSGTAAGGGTTAATVTRSTPAPSTTSPTATGQTAPTPPPKRPGPRGGSRRLRSGEQGPRGGGDEQAPHVPAAFALHGGRLTPAVITVPAFFRVALTMANGDSRPHKVVLMLPGASRTLMLVAGGRASVVLAGLRKGAYVLTIDGHPGGRLVSGLQPGP